MFIPTEGRFLLISSFCCFLIIDFPRYRPSTCTPVQSQYDTFDSRQCLTDSPIFLVVFFERPLWSCDVLGWILRCLVQFLVLVGIKMESCLKFWKAWSSDVLFVQVPQLADGNQIWVYFCFIFQKHWKDHTSACYPSSHNHGSVRNGCISNSSDLSYTAIFHNGEFVSIALTSSKLQQFVGDHGWGSVAWVHPKPDVKARWIFGTETSRKNAPNMCVFQSFLGHDPLEKNMSSTL